MPNNFIIKLQQLFSVKPLPAGPELQVAQSPPLSLPASLGLDQLGVPVDNPLRAFTGHCMILGATGTGKTSLVKTLLSDLDCQVLWLPDADVQTSVLRDAICQQQRFELPVLLVVDDAHLFVEHMELLELVARDGRKSNIFLLLTAQLLSDVPRAVWQNCQIRFAIGHEARQQLNAASDEHLAAYVAHFSWPGKQGLIRIAESKLENKKLPDQGNPLLRRASTPQLAPYEESAPTRQTPSDQWSMEELAEPQGLHDRQLGNTALPHRTRYSRTL